LDRQLAAFREQSIDVAGMLTAQQAKFKKAWQHFSTHFPKKSAGLRQRLNQAAELIQKWEDARSELTRLAWIGRIWALKAGDRVRVDGGTGIVENLDHGNR
jgi:hypothetical protein